MYFACVPRAAVLELFPIPSSQPMTSSEFDSLAQQCLEIFQSEGEAGVDRFCKAHPHHATRLRETLDELLAVKLIDEPIVDQPTAAAPTVAVPAVGQSFGGFRLRAELGRGGMGVVYLAEQTALRRQVALKLMRLDVFGNERGRARFDREVDSLSKLDHASICTIYEAGDVDGVPYLSMQYIGGGTLANAIAADDKSAKGAIHSSLNALRARVELIEKVARALHCAHVAGLVHRDVKPANILLDGTGLPVLVDFGLVRDENDMALTASTDQLGTIPYMALRAGSRRGSRSAYGCLRPWSHVVRERDGHPPVSWPATRRAVPQHCSLGPAEPTKSQSPDRQGSPSDSRYCDG